MATRTRSSKPARQLGELLQEQQEPFILDVYLSERGYVKKSLTSEDKFIGCHGNSCRFLNKSASLNKSKQGMPQFPKVLKLMLCSKFFKIKGFKGLRSTKNSNGEDGKLSVTDQMDLNNQETSEADRFSSASSATVYNSCPDDSDIDDEPSMFADNSMPDLKLYDERENKAVVKHSKFEWNCLEEKKHCSPRSVLEQVSTSTSSPLHNSRQVPSKRLFWSKLIKVDSIWSAWFLNLLLQTRPQKSSCAGLKELQVPDLSNSSRSSKSTRVLQQRKQLFFDRISEWVENSHDKEEKGKSFKGSDDEEIKKVGFENMKRWGKRCGDGSNIKQLLELDIINSTREWKNEFESQKRDIELGIGNAIMEDIMSEVIKDLINVL